MLELKDITFSYSNGPKIFNQFNKNFEENGLYKVSGSNGLGKTTLLKIISHLITPKDGTIRWKGSPVTMDQVNYLSSNETAFFDQMTGQEGLDLFSKLNGASIEQTKAKYLLSDELFQKILPMQFYQMSSGMKRLFLNALVFTKQAEIFLLDEPFVGMDKERKLFFSKFLTKVSKESLILIASHEELSELHPKEDIILSPIQSGQ